MPESLLVWQSLLIDQHLLHWCAPHMAVATTVLIVNLDKHEHISKTPWTAYAFEPTSQFPSLNMHAYEVTTVAGSSNADMQGAAQWASAHACSYSSPRFFAICMQVSQLM